MAINSLEKGSVRKVFSHNMMMLLSINEMTVADLARRLDMRDTTVRDWSIARSFPGAENMERLAQVLGVKPSVLLEDGANGEGLSRSQMELIKKASDFTEAEAEVALRVLSAIRNE